jgi:predicted N-acyltransferase
MSPRGYNDKNEGGAFLVEQGWDRHHHLEKKTCEQKVFSSYLSRNKFLKLNTSTRRNRKPN